MFPPRPNHMTTKLCNKCQQTKLFCEFPKGRDSNGLYYICKSCITMRTQLRYRTMDKLQRWVDHTLIDVRGRAKRSDIAFDLTKDDFYQMYNEQQGKCAYCTIEFNLNNSRYARRDSPSTDRLVPTVGYVKRNVVLCCHRCNAIKQDTTPQELMNIALAVASLFEQKGITTGHQSCPSQTV